MSNYIPLCLDFRLSLFKRRKRWDQWAQSVGYPTKKNNYRVWRVVWILDQVTHQSESSISTCHPMTPLLNLRKKGKKSWINKQISVMNDREVNHVRRSGGQRVLERGSRERKREREALPWLQLTQQERLPWLQPYQGHASRRRRFIPALLCLIFHLAPLLFRSSFSQVQSFFLFSFFFQALFGC